MGAAAIPLLVGIQVIGLVVCLCMGELAALWPHRTGGTPSYAAECFKPFGAKTALHVGGLSTWGYWLGWFTVAPINMILAANYIAALFHVPLGKIVDPAGSLGTPEGIGVLAIMDNPRLSSPARTLYHATQAHGKRRETVAVQGPSRLA